MLLGLVRPGGRYAQVGLFGHSIAWDLEQICFKELQVSGSFATVPSAWRKALALMASGQVQTAPLVSHRMKLSEWEPAFRLFEERAGLKILLTPQEGA
jgi:L-iditol 2-dehydrogenase